MSNPAFVEAWRGGRVESTHRGSAAVVDAEGSLMLGLGEVERPVYPRSAVKALQALPLVESGAAERFGLTEAELALCCASHSGEPIHVETARAILAKAGQDERALECGAHWPVNDKAARALMRDGRVPTALHNNCSGKHAGFICLACALGEKPAGYVAPTHRVQREVKAALEGVCGERLDDERRGVDGCSVPTWAISLVGLARGFARFATGRGLAPRRAAAAARLKRAITTHPYLVGGAARFDTEVMTLSGGRALTKTGAEGVFCAALPAQGLGVALKIDDGATRAAEAALARLLVRFGGFEGTMRERLEAFAAPKLTNWNGLEVGALRPTQALA